MIFPKIFFGFLILGNCDIDVVLGLLVWLTHKLHKSFILQSWCLVSPWRDWPDVGSSSCPARPRVQAGCWPAFRSRHRGYAGRWPPRVAPPARWCSPGAAHPAGETTHNQTSFNTRAINISTEHLNWCPMLWQMQQTCYIILHIAIITLIIQSSV